MAKVTVLGAGGWGIALALTAFKTGNEVSVWVPEHLGYAELKETRTNEKLLKGIYLPQEIDITCDINSCADSDIVIIAVPSTAVADVSSQLKKVKGNFVIANAAKGFEGDTLLRLSEVISSNLPDKKIVALTGPSHAEEVSRDRPTSIVAACDDLAAAEIVQKARTNDDMRVYTNPDIIGAELGGALKNVIAICVGFCNGLKLGDNTRAALITRGLAEMSRLGTKMGADEHTFAGLTGIGDLVVTCMSEHSRNNRFGTLVGAGVEVETALNTVGTVEGYYAASAAHRLAEKYGVEMPIITECYKVLYEGINPLDSVKRLMARPISAERKGCPH